MKMPEVGPELGPIQREMDAEVLAVALKAGVAELHERRYEPWEKIRRRSPPMGLSLPQWWWGIKQARLAGRRDLKLLDATGTPFSLAPTDRMVERNTAPT